MIREQIIGSESSLCQSPNEPNMNLSGRISNELKEMQDASYGRKLQNSAYNKMFWQEIYHAAQ